MFFKSQTNLTWLSGKFRVVISALSQQDEILVDVRDLGERATRRNPGGKTVATVELPDDGPTIPACYAAARQTAEKIWELYRYDLVEFGETVDTIEEYLRPEILDIAGFERDAKPGDVLGHLEKAEQVEGERPFWRVIVGNIGTVYDGKDEVEARKVYATYKEYSEKGYGRAAGEAVDLLKESADGQSSETLESYEGTKRLG